MPLSRKAQSSLEYASISIFVIIGIILMGGYTVKSINAYFRGIETSIKDSFEEVVLQDPEGNYQLPPCTCTDKIEQLCGDYVYCQPHETLFRRDCQPKGCRPEYFCIEAPEACCEWRTKFTCAADDRDWKDFCGSGQGVEEKFCGPEGSKISYDEYRCFNNDDCRSLCPDWESPVQFNKKYQYATLCDLTWVDPIPVGTTSWEFLAFFEEDQCGEDDKKCQAVCNLPYVPYTSKTDCKCGLFKDQECPFDYQIKNPTEICVDPIVDLSRNDPDRWQTVEDDSECYKGAGCKAFCEDNFVAVDYPYVLGTQTRYLKICGCRPDQTDQMLDGMVCYKSHLIRASDLPPAICSHNHGFDFRRNDFITYRQACIEYADEKTLPGETRYIEGTQTHSRWHACDVERFCVYNISEEKWERPRCNTKKRTKHITCATTIMIPLLPCECPEGYSAVGIEPSQNCPVGYKENNAIPCDADTGTIYDLW